MPYATQSDIENRIGAARLAQLADLDGDGSADSAVLDAALDKAQQLIDAHIRSRYRLPLSSVPSIVRELALDLGIYFLQQNRRESVTERDRQAYDDALDFLRRVSAGDAGLDLGDAATDGLTETDLPRITTPLADHPPLYRKKDNQTSNLDHF